MWFFKACRVFILQSFLWFSGYRSFKRLLDCSFIKGSMFFILLQFDIVRTSKDLGRFP